MAFRFLSSREITNYCRPRCSWLKLHFLPFFNWIFYPKQRWWVVWSLKQEKPQRQRRSSTHDVTESSSTFTRNEHFNIWFNVEPLMESSLNTNASKSWKRSYAQFTLTLMVMLILHCTSTCNREFEDVEIADIHNKMCSSQRVSEPK